MFQLSPQQPIYPRHKFPAGSAFALTLAALLCLGATVPRQRKRPLPVPPKPKITAHEEFTGPVQMPAPLPLPEMTQADLTAFFDGLVPLQIERDNIAGAVVAVVKDGKVIFAKGYGYADFANKTPISPETTLFRVGSISKLFTWTAVMQLVQQGKINLDQDINGYLDFHVPEPRGKITMRDLMTHTPGFEEAIQDLITRNPADLEPLRTYLVTHMPAQIFPPGTTGAYSNYGATLAGYIVQRVSGQPFSDYIEQHIFTPLGMTHATFVQPLPTALKPDMSDGYELASGGAKPFEIVTPYPAGSLSVSAMDITHFMIAQLQNGAYNGAQILSPATIQVMHSRQYGFDPRLNHMCLGFYEESQNGQRIIGHGGDTEYFHSDLHLILAADVGLFVSYNSLGRGDVEPRVPLFHKFLDRYFPYTPPEGKPLPTAAQDARAVSGYYIASRRPQTNIFYLFALVGEDKVSPRKDGKLTVQGMKGVNGQTLEWREVAPQVWQDTSEPQNEIVFHHAAHGRWKMGMEFPAEILQEVAWYRSRAFIQFIIGFAVLIFLLTLLLWPFAALARRHYRRTPNWTARERSGRKWIRIVCAFNLFFWVAFVGTIIYAGAHLGVLSHHLNPWLRLIQISGWIGALGTILAIWNFFVSLRIEGRWWWAKVHDTLVLLACFASVWAIWFTHLLAFSLRY